jgi:hypothetical protein
MAFLGSCQWLEIRQLTAEDARLGRSHCLIQVNGLLTKLRNLNMQQPEPRTWQTARDDLLCHVHQAASVFTAETVDEDRKTNASLGGSSNTTTDKSHFLI